MQSSSKQRGYSSRLLVLLLLLFAHAEPGCSSTGLLHPASATSLSVPAASVPKPFPDATRIDAYLSQLANAGDLSGTVLLAENGQLFSKGYSLADKDAALPNTPQTMFRVGSITKQFTAMAILILQERGKLHVQDHLCLYVPDCPQDWQPITIQHLLTHSSGLSDYINSPDFVNLWTQPATPEQLLARFKDLPLDFPPGSQFRYSNSGYTVLGYIIERVTGEPYATFLQKEILGPLKLNYTGYDSTTLRPGHAIGYYANYVRPNPYDMSELYAAGALYSTSEDLYTWDQALAQHKLISQQSIDDMLSPHIPCPRKVAREAVRFRHQSAMAMAGLLLKIRWENLSIILDILMAI